MAYIPEIPTLQSNPANIPKSPNSAMTIYTGIPWDSDYYNVRLFENEEERRGYLASSGHAPRQFHQVTYIRETGAIRLPLSKEILDRYNYCHFDNAIAYGGINRVYFAFIVRREWVNYNVCDIWIKLDYFQTFFLDFTTGAFPVAQGLVEREHTASDLYAEHRVDEGLDWGEYIQDKSISVDNLISFTPISILVLSEIDALADSGMFPDIPVPQNFRSGKMNNSVNALYYIATNSTAKIFEVADLLSKKGKAAALIDIFSYPQEFIRSTFLPSDLSEYYFILLDRDVTSKLYLSFTGFAAGAIDGYTPKNKKCYLYPFRAIEMSIQGSGAKVYKYEDFTAVSMDAEPTGRIWQPFKVFAALQRGAPMLVSPQNYLGILDNVDEALTGSTYGVGNWITDNYAQWIAYNQESMNLQKVLLSENNAIAQRHQQQIADIATIESAVNGGMSGVTNGVLMGNSFGPLGSFLGGVLGGVGGALAQSIPTGLKKEVEIQQANEVRNFNYSSLVKNQIVENNKNAIIPDSANGGSGGGALAYSAGYDSIIARPKCLRKEAIQQADNYFSLYGYKVMRLKTPNLKTRKAWNYVKMCIANITDDFMPDVKDTFKRVLERGVTFWHTNDMFNYDLDNSPTPQAREGV